MLTIKDATGNTPIDVTGVTLNKAQLDLDLGYSETLIATVQPNNATDKTVKWSSDKEAVATVDQTGKVTAKGVGTADITATAGGKSDTCTVTVKIPEANGITFTNPAEAVWGLGDDNPWELTVDLTPAGSEMQNGDYVAWSVTPDDATLEEDLRLTAVQKAGTKGLTARLTNHSPGRYTVTATYMKGGKDENGLYSGGEATDSKATKTVVVSGITLTRRELKMLVGGSGTVAVDTAYGYAAGGSVRDVVWTSSDPSIVTVLSGGDLMAWNTGTVIITANMNGYTAECEVTVGEDEDAIVGPYSATSGTPLIMSTIYTDLNGISIKKTQTTDAQGNLTGGSPLNYITNVRVPTSQGTLYYNYNSEANTGAGVGVTDRFAQTSAGTVQSLDRLYFVPRQDFTGTAEITFNGWAQNGTSFSGVIRVNVTGVDHISYRTNAGEAVNFLSGDFNAFCRYQTGREINYVTFNLPQASQGTLYYNYTAPGQYGDRVTTSTQYSRAGQYLIEEVSFVPNDAFIGEARISFRGVDTAGKSFTGEVVVSVYPSSTDGDTANVYISGERGQPVALQGNLFNDACQATIRDTLSHVTFTLPDYSDGTLYYNYRGANSYDGRVSASTRYFYSGVPGISSVSFVPASNGTGRVAIPYSGYGTGGTAYTGTLYITIGDTDRSTVRYFVPKNGSVSFNSNDFNSASLLQLGVGLDHVEFQVPDIDSKVGRLYYDYQGNSYNNGVYSDFDYYRNPQQSYQGRIDLISFRAGASAGTVTIPYTAYTAADSSGDRQSYQGAVVIQVGSPTPADVSISCRTSGQGWLSGYDLSNACSPVISGNLSYIEITGLPDPAKGRVYSGYTGFGTGSEVARGDRFYCLGGPNIDQVCFVPHSGFTGQTEITYVGFSSNGQEQVSGRILVNVSQTTRSQYFNDMGSYVWAIDSVDYLYQNNAVKGVGGGRYNPRGSITKGDFTLMLVRAFGFTATGSVTYKDVPANSYYAEAIRIAGLLGIGSSSNGNYYPNVALSRQDAMVMIRNALVADGRTLTNGLAADLSGYYDEKQIANYARAAVGSLVQMGIVKGDGNGYLRPNALLNRAETAMLLHTLMTM